MDEYYEAKPDTAWYKWKRDFDGLKKRQRRVERVRTELGYMPEAERYEMERLHIDRVDLMWKSYHAGWGWRY